MSFQIVEVDSLPASSTATVTAVAASTSAVTLLAANDARLGASIHNNGNRTLYVKLGTGVSSSSFTVELPKTYHYEVPNRYTGIIEGVWANGVSGDAQVTEFAA